jgi:hypothetical protein
MAVGRRTAWCTVLPGWAREDLLDSRLRLDRRDELKLTSKPPATNDS